MNAFSETGLQDKILQAIKELGFEKPTPIQAKAIPHLLNTSQDLLAFAQTGTGKTAAFGLPAVHLTNVQDKSTQTLVLCPTRELCLQITDDLTQYSKFIKGLGIVAVYGGASIETQIHALKREAQIVVGTPGRVKDLVNRKRLNLGNVVRVVLDEADEMLNMGFKDDLDAILAEVPEERQTLLFSATMSKKVITITKKYMNNPVEMAVARMNIGAENVKHIFYQVQARDKYELLKRVADLNPDIYGIVFCRTRRETTEIANKLMHDGYNADAIHGDLSQAQRDEVMGRFRVGQLQILVATDVAARGLDVDDLTHVINFSLPDDDEVYVHRSGRTGRAGKSGISIAIIHTRETGRIREIERKSGIRFSKELAPTGKEICQRQLLTLIDKIEKVEVDEKQIEPFLPEIYQKLDWLSREELIKHFVSAEFNRFLAYYKNSRDINVGERERKSPMERRQTSFSRMFINVGANNNLTPARLLGLINQGLDSSAAEIGKIEILKNFSFFEIDEKSQVPLMRALVGETFEGVSLNVEISNEKSGGAPVGYVKPKSPKPAAGNFSKRRTSKPESSHRSKGGSPRRSGKKWRE